MSDSIGVSLRCSTNHIPYPGKTFGPPENLHHLENRRGGGASRQGRPKGLRKLAQLDTLRLRHAADRGLEGRRRPVRNLLEPRGQSLEVSDGVRGEEGRSLGIRL